MYGLASNSFHRAATHLWLCLIQRSLLTNIGQLSEKFKNTLKQAFKTYSKIKQKGVKTRQNTNARKIVRALLLQSKSNNFTSV